MYKVYILQSEKDKRTYVGFSDDVARRLKQHNSGQVAATKDRRPLNLIFTEDAVTIELAKNREKYWKSGGGRRRLKGYFSNGFPPR